MALIILTRSRALTGRMTTCRRLSFNIFTTGVQRHMQANTPLVLLRQLFLTVRTLRAAIALQQK